MKFSECRSVKQVGETMLSKGFTPGENAIFDLVERVHSDTSMHYKVFRDGKIVDGPLKNGVRQGKLALDVNDNDVDDDAMPFDSEREALAWLYHKLLKVFGPNGFNVIDEMFFNGYGFIKEAPQSNHPIGGHDGHLHIAFKRNRWG